MTSGKKILKGRCKNKHCSAMSNSASCDLNSKGDILKLHDKGPNPNCNCQKVITSKPHQYILEGGSIKPKLQKIFGGTKKAWDSFIKPGLKMATSLISATVAAKTKSPHSIRITNKISKSLTGGKILSLTDIHGRGLRLKVM